MQPGCVWVPSPPGVACVSVPIADVAMGTPCDGPPAAMLAAMLSDEERLRYAQLPIRKRRIEWLAGRIAAKHALQRLTGAAHLPHDATVRRAPCGRPAFDTATLSISHSGREAMAAAAYVPVGVDTETFDALGATSLDLVVRPWEAHGVSRGLGCDFRAARTLVWCLKEALFKAAGSGGFVRFGVALQVLSWQPGQQRPVWRWDPPESQPAWPTLAAWQACFGWHHDAAWVLVSPMQTRLFS